MGPDGTFSDIPSCCGSASPATPGTGFPAEHHPFICPFPDLHSVNWCELAFDTRSPSATTAIAGTSKLSAGVELGGVAQGIAFVIRIGWQNTCHLPNGGAKTSAAV
jgi:hypothetical protein